MQTIYHAQRHEIKQIWDLIGPREIYTIYF